MPKQKPKEKDNDHSPEEAIPSSIARFGTSLFLKGELSGDEDLVIQGRFQGKINLRNNNILVSEEGNIKADIQVNNITVKGSVKGNIHAAGKVFISEEGQMEGDIIAPTISIMDGARFKGSVIMDTEVKHIALPEKEKKETGALFPQEESVREEKEIEKEADTGDDSDPKFHDL
jgi:cytoskeletal protein CcmA (bactofilin family)